MEMKIKGYGFESATDGWNIHSYYLIPQQDMKAVVYIVHGMYEKAIRYQHFMNFLYDNGYGAYSMDHRGHGESCQRGIGDLGDADVYLKMIRDMRTMILKIRATHPAHKLILFGHSMGSFLAQRYIQIYPNTIDALLLSGSGGKDQAAVAVLGKNMAYSLKKLGLSNRRSFPMFFMQQRVLSRNIKDKKTMYDWICSDERVIEEYRRDNQLGIPYTVNSYYYVYKGISENFQRRNMVHVNRNLPIFMVSGAKDPVGNFGKGVHLLVRWYKSFDINNVECKIYPNMRHEVLNEYEKETVMEDILEWLKKMV